MRVGFVGWRGMVGSVLMQRMQEERDFEHIDPVFFSTSSVGGKGPAIGKDTPPLKDASDIAALKSLDVDRHLPGRRLHQRRLPAAARRGLERLLDRRRVDAADEGRRRHHPRPGQPQRHRRGARPRGEELHRRQLHGQPDADGAGGPVPAQPHRVDDVHDLPGGVRRRRAEHARAPGADGRGAHGGARPAGRSRVGDPRHRPRGRRHPARPGVPEAALRRAARRQPDPLDRQGPGQRQEPRGVEGRRRDQQDPGPRAPTRSRSTRSACASAPCAATARR